ncbi:MAG: hypothetical protein OJF60_000225 [Burkholderiaceae bacterium]|jgi:hypothetical protein|nr:MAG: hypothetical protein OJF60_000225 [Burkholderiaceae bacterium]
MKTNFRHTAITAALGFALFGIGLAQAAPLPPMQKADGIEFMTGGIGEGQSSAMENEGRHWPLMLEFATRDHAKSDFAANVKVMVKDAKGHTVLDTTSSGPFLLARLDPGQYTVDATFAGKTMQQKVEVGKTPTRHLFLWPQGTGE